MMTRTTRALAALTVTGSLFAVPALATAADTTVSFTVAASGALAVAQGGSTATLDNGGSPLDFNALGSGSVSGTLPETTVTDTRGVPAGGWTVSVVATGDFVNGSDAGITVAASNARAYLAATDLTDLTTNVLSGAITGMVVTGAELTVGANNLSSSYTLLSGTSTLGTGTIVYTPTVSVTVPAATPAGTYTAVVQQTVS